MSASMSVTPSNSGKSLVELASSSSPGALHPEEWSAQHVVRWLGSLTPSSISKTHSAAFLENDIAGEVLIRLDADTLKDLGLTSVGHRLAVLKGIYELKMRWNIEIEADDWRPTQTDLAKATLANISTFAMMRALQERDERVRALELELARLEDWLVRWSTEPNKTDSLPPYFPPSRVYCSIPDGMAPPEAVQAEHLPPSAFSGPVTATSNYGLDSAYDDANRSRKPSTTLTPSSSTFTANRSGSVSQLMDLSPTSSNATPSATPTSAQPPSAIASVADSPSMHRIMSPKVASNNLPGNTSAAPATTPSPVYRVKDNSGGPSSPLLSTLANNNKDRAGSSSADAPYKSFRVTLDDPCHKVLPAALKKYKIDDDWKLYALFICYGNTERCLSYDEKPLLLFQKLKEAKQSPVFMLRHIKDVKSPIAIASAKAEARRNTAAASEESKSAAASRLNSMASYMSGVKVMGAKGDTEGGKDDAFVDSPPGQPKISGPASMIEISSDEEESPDTYAVSIYPYVSEREDELDVSVGDTFVVKSKAKGWWIVQRDTKATGQADVIGITRNADGSPKNGGEIQSGWVPAGCLLETKQPLSMIIPSQKIQSPNTPNDGTFSNLQQRTPLSPTSAIEEDNNTPKASSSLAHTMANAPIPPSLITSTSTPGILLMDYHSIEDNFHLKKDTRLRVFKRYNHWSYCVDVGAGHSRAWLPSWYIGKISTRSNSTKHSASASVDTSIVGGSAASTTQSQRGALAGLDLL